MQTEPEVWTIAYRKPTANRFQRVTNWAGTWQAAADLATPFALANPELQVWTTPTLAYEQAHPDSEDNGNILVDSGKRVRVVDNATLGNEWLIPAHVTETHVIQYDFSTN